MKNNFQYPNTNSARAKITDLDEKYKGLKIAIIGLGGTGSYVLDLIAKTPVAEIHIFDKDVFQLHNAFRAPGATSPFVTAAVAFFIAEMGDKTQLATVALGARFDMLAAVVIGTTLGMLIANIPAVLVGEALAQKLPMKAIRIAAAGVFIVTGLVTMFGMPNLVQ